MSPLFKYVCTLRFLSWQPNFLLRFEHHTSLHWMSLQVFSVCYLVSNNMLLRFSCLINLILSTYCVIFSADYILELLESFTFFMTVTSSVGEREILRNMEKAWEKKNSLNNYFYPLLNMQACGCTKMNVAPCILFKSLQPNVEISKLFLDRDR